MRVATDVSGIFTDLVFYEYDEATGKVNNMKTEKSDTVSLNFEQGVMNTISRPNWTPSDPTRLLLVFAKHEEKLRIFSCKPFKHLGLKI